MASEQPKDFAYGYDVKPIAPVQAAHDDNHPAKSAHDLTAMLALQWLAREGADEGEVRYAAEVFLAGSNIVEKLVPERLTPEQAAQALKAIEPFEANARQAQKNLEALDLEHTLAGRVQRPGHLTETEWQSQVEAARVQLRSGLSDPLEVENAYYSAKDPVSLAAFESLGPIFDKTSKQLVTSLAPEKIAARQLERYRALYPSAYAERQKIARLASVYRQAADFVKTEVRKRSSFDTRPIVVL